MTSVGGTSGLDQRRQMMQDRFRKVDSDENGSLSREEFGAISEKPGLSTDKLDEMFAQADSDSDGEVTQDEMKAAFKGKAQKMRNRSGESDLSRQLQSAVESGDQEQITSLIDQIQSNYSSGRQGNSEGDMTSMLFDTVA